MSFDLYYTPASAPCRSVLMVGKELGIEINLKPVDLWRTRDHMKPEFLAMNPQHTVPTLVDNDSNYTLWESRAIITYLVGKTSPGHQLYPTDLKVRSVIDRWLFFDAGSLMLTFRPIFVTKCVTGTELSETAVAAVNEKLQQLDDALGEKKFLAGDRYTLADFAVLATMTLVEAVDLDISQFGHLQKWYNNMKQELPYFADVNAAGIEAIRAKVMATKKA